MSEDSRASFAATLQKEIGDLPESRRAKADIHRAETLAADIKAFNNYARNKEWAKVGPYQTALNPNEERDFRAWVDNHQIPFNPDQRFSDYDMRGYWKSLLDPGAERQDPTTGHFPDTFKTPYHETFSNESKYATYDAPKWVNNKLIDKTGNVVADESQAIRPSILTAPAAGTR